MAVAVNHCPFWSTNWNFGMVFGSSISTELSSLMVVLVSIWFCSAISVGVMVRQAPWPPQNQIILISSSGVAIELALFSDCCSGNSPSSMPWMNNVGTSMFAVRKYGPLEASNACWPGVRMPTSVPRRNAG